MNNLLLIKNGKIITENSIIPKKNVLIKGGKIIEISATETTDAEIIDAHGCYVSPGFIDTHVHGGGGYDFMDGGEEPIIKAAEFHLNHGTTTILPTTLSCSFETLKEFMTTLKAVMEKGLCKANIPGAHLEGPYFALAQCGAQNPDYITPPVPAEYEEIIKTFGNIVKKWSFAPENPGSEEFCEALTSAGIVPSAGHSDGTFEDMEKVYKKGCKHFTHLYSGMSTITRQDGYRKLGIIESAYYYDDVYAEVIADGKHLPPELLKLIVKCKGTEHICLVTDAMRGAGQLSGESYLGKKGEEVPCIIDDGVAKLPDQSAFAGSVATADRLVRTMVKEADISVSDAVKMITEVPANICGFETKGKIKENYDADIVIFDDNINVKNVIVGGKIIK